MKQYFDLVAASMIIRDARESGVAINAAMHKLDLEWMVGFLDLPDEEKWQRLKEHFAGSPMGVIVMGGLIDFDPVEMARLEGARPTYDENLELQKAAIDTECVRVSLIPAYYDCEILESFKAQVAQIDKQSGKIRFWRVLVTGWYDGNQMFAPYEGNEYDIFMDLKGFERYQAGDYLSFDAEVYRYIDTVATKEGETRIISFGLRNPISVPFVGYVIGKTIVTVSSASMRIGRNTCEKHYQKPKTFERSSRGVVIKDVSTFFLHSRKIE